MALAPSPDLFGVPVQVEQRAIHPACSPASIPRLRRDRLDTFCTARRTPLPR